MTLEDRMVGPHEAVDDGVAPALTDPGLDAVRCAECGSHTFCLLKGLDGEIHLVCSRCCGEKGVSVDGVIPASIGTPRNYINPRAADLSARDVPEGMDAAAAMAAGMRLVHSWGEFPEPRGEPIGGHAPLPKEGDVVLIDYSEGPLEGYHHPYLVVGAAGGRVALLTPFKDSIVDVPVAGLELISVDGLVATWRLH
jgi:hypothetical protein